MEYSNRCIKTLIKIASRFLLLGALFDVNVNENKQMFQFAIEQVNEKFLNEEEFRLEGEVVDISYGNEITISHSLCSLLEVLFFSLWTIRIFGRFSTVRI